MEQIDGKLRATECGASSRCVIHIGMRKTGSTSIQKSLADNESRTHVYAQLGPTNHGRTLHNLVVQKQFEPLAESIKRARGKALIISGEGIPRVFSEADLAELKAFLDGHFEKIEIVAYIRDPGGYIASNFQQRVKNGVASFDLVDSAPRYRKWFEKFDSVFGRQNVQLWMFDPSTFPEGCVVQDFCRRLDLEKPARVTRKNDSLTREALTLLYIFHRYAKNESDRPTSIRLVKMVKQLGGSPFRFSPDTISPVLEECKKDIWWMERRLGEPLSDLGARSPHDVQTEADLTSPGGSLQKELEQLKHWGDNRDLDQFARMVKRVQRVLG